MIKVTDNLYRGPRPKDLQELKDQGFTQVINLESGIYEFFHDDKMERQSKSEEFDDILYRRISCNDFLPPEVYKVTQAIYYMRQYSDLKTYVHCLSGVDRTGFVCAVYRMKEQGWSYEEAYKEWVQLGRHWWYDFWKYELKKYEVRK